MQRFQTLNNTDGAITMANLRKAIPSVGATTAHPRMSNRYAFVSTESIIESLVKEHDYEVQSVSQRSTRVRDPMFTRHMIRLRQRGVKPIVGEAVPELIITNSHDGQSKFHVSGGLFRFVCANGLVTAIAGMVASERHRGDPAVIVAAGLEVVNEVKKIGPRVNKMMKTKLSDQRATAFAAKAAKIAYDDINFDPKLLLSVRRPEDEGMDVWRVFNRIQENITRGGIEFQAKASGRTFATKGISHIGRTIQFNSELWTAAEKLVA